MLRLLTLLVVLFIAVTKVTGQKAVKLDTLKYVYKIDKYCNSIFANKKYITTVACGDNNSSERTESYNKDFTKSEVVRKSQNFADSLRNFYANEFYFKNGKLVKAIMTFSNYDRHIEYKAQYYFNKDILIFASGETERKFTAEEIILSSSNNGFCLPKF